MREAALAGSTTATDLADYLVRKQVPFRDAHELVGGAVQRAVELNRPLEALSLEQLNGASDGPIDADVYNVLSLDGSIAARDHFGAGTAQVRAQAQAALSRLKTSNDPHWVAGNLVMSIWTIVITLCTLVATCGHKGPCSCQKLRQKVCRYQQPPRSSDYEL